MMNSKFAASVMDRPRSRSKLFLDIPQAAGAGCDSIQFVLRNDGAASCEHYSGMRRPSPEKSASDRKQAALHRGNLADWVNGEEKLSGEQQLRQLQDACRILEDRIKVAPAAKKKALGLEKLATQSEIQQLRKRLHMERRAMSGISPFFFDAARAILPKVQFDMIWRSAIREYDLNKAALNSENDASAA